MKALETGRLAVWAAIAIGVLTVVVGAGLAWRFELLMPSWWRYWDRPELLYPEELAKPIHARIPQELPSTPTPTVTSSPRPNAKTRFSGDLAPTPIPLRPVVVPPTPSVIPTFTFTSSPTPTFTPRPPLKPGTVFFSEDFSGVTEGLLPEGWTGGEKLAVVSQGSKRVLQAFEKTKEYKVHTSLIETWPEDFRMEWVIKCDADTWSESYLMLIGDLTVELKLVPGSWSSARFQMNESRAEVRNFSGQGGTVFRVAVEKRGAVFKGYVDGVELIVMRMESFRPPQHLTLTINGAYRFAIERILAFSL
jgi:hypothetical protein